MDKDINEDHYVVMATKTEKQMSAEMAKSPEGRQNALLTQSVT